MKDLNYEENLFGLSFCEITNKFFSLQIITGKCLKIKPCFSQTSVSYTLHLKKICTMCGLSLLRQNGLYI